MLRSLRPPIVWRVIIVWPVCQKREKIVWPEKKVNIVFWPVKKMKIVSDNGLCQSEKVKVVWLVNSLTCEKSEISLACEI